MWVIDLQFKLGRIRLLLGTSTAAIWLSLFFLHVGLQVKYI